MSAAAGSGQSGMWKMREQSTFGYENNQFVENGELDMERALQKFQVMKAEYRDED